MITQKYLKTLMRYSRSTGLFTRVVTRSPNACAGQIAGTPDVRGYIQIQIDGKIYKAHRLAWLHETGDWPEGEIDHRDCNRANNKWRNLRDASRPQNAANCRTRSDNKSGMKGACFIASRGKWLAQIQVSRKCKFLGYYETVEAAHAAYAAAALLHHQEFARTK